MFKKQQTTKEPAITVENPSKLRTLKGKVGYDELNDEIEKRTAGKRSIQTMQISKEVESTEKHGIQNMEIDIEAEW